MLRLASAKVVRNALHCILLPLSSANLTPGHPVLPLRSPFLYSPAECISRSCTSSGPDRDQKLRSSAKNMPLPKGYVVVTPHTSAYGRLDQWPSLLINKLKQHFDVQFVKYGPANKNVHQDEGVPTPDTDIITIAHSLEDEDARPAFSLLYLDLESFLIGHDPSGRLQTALRKLVSCSRTCIVARQSREVVLSILPGLLDGARIVTPGMAGLNSEKRCNLIPDAVYDPYRRVQHQNFLYAEMFTSLTKVDEIIMQGHKTDTLEEHLDAVVNTASSRYKLFAPLRSEILVRSAALLWLPKTQIDRDLIEYWIRSFVALDTLSVIKYAGAEGNDERTVDTGTVDASLYLQPPLRGLTCRPLSDVNQSGKSLDLMLLPDIGDHALTAIQDTNLLSALNKLAGRTKFVLAQGSSVLLLAGAGLLHSSAAISRWYLDRARTLYPNIEWTSSTGMEDHREADLDCVVLAEGENSIPQGIGPWSRNLPSVVLGGQRPEETRSHKDNGGSSGIQQQRQKTDSSETRPQKDNDGQSGIQQQRQMTDSVALADLSWQDLLTRINYLHELKGGSGGLTMSPGADEAALNAVEARIGEPLPEDLKAFLSLSDGLASISLHCFDFHGLRPARELDWCPNAVHAAVPLVVEPEFVVDDTIIDRLPTAPQIGLLQLSDEEEDVWLISPRLVKEARNQVNYTGNNEIGWRVMTWKHWDPEHTPMFVNFRAFMEYICTEMERSSHSSVQHCHHCLGTSTITSSI